MSCHVQNRDQQLGPNISRSLFQPHHQPPVVMKGACSAIPAPVSTSSHAWGFTASAALHTSLAEGAAGLIAVSTAAAAAANKSDVSQVSFCRQHGTVGLQLDCRKLMVHPSCYKPSTKGGGWGGWGETGACIARMGVNMPCVTGLPWRH